HYEVELVLRICRLGKNIAPEFAHRYYDGIGLGIDFTARDVQEELKKKSLPWEKAKGFDGSAVVGEKFLPVEMVHDSLPFSLRKNDEVVQQGSRSQMIFSFDQIIAYVSRYMTLKIGDLIFTGTPQGVGPVKPDDVLAGYLGDEEMFRIKIK
ncbi:MAG: fumarylacetoacetate hydrolase family protein, partial [Flavobacteriales bacterium]|nr:fumarylacetoacetate hydrolase family protein [Flavobacteriales bacterium]